MPKKQLLPLSGDSHKREVSVNLRFSVDDHARLKRVAEFSDTTVANLLFYVTMNTTLPMMEQEVQRAGKPGDEKVTPNKDVPLSPVPGRPILTPDREQAQP